MKLTRLAAAAAVAGALSGAPAFAQDVTLTIHHFLPPHANAHAQMIQVWADRVSKQSDGRIAFEIFPAMSMGGRPPELYSQARDGSADIVWTLLGYTPGVFPRSEVFELPLVHRGSATATTIALNENFDLIADDFTDVHVLFLHTHDGNLIHMTETAVRSFDDVQGLKIRTPGRTGAWLLEAWGSEPVGMPVPQLPQAMARGVVDGALTTYEIVPALRLQELNRFVTELPDGDRFGTAVFMLAMNKERYEELPEDLRAILDANSRANVGPWIGELWEGFEAGGVQALADAGVETIILDEAEAARFNAAAETVVARWIAEINELGVDGEDLVARARAAVEAASQ